MWGEKSACDCSPLPGLVYFVNTPVSKRSSPGAEDRVVESMGRTPERVERLLDNKQIDVVLDELWQAVVLDGADPTHLVVIGIRSRGEVLAERLATCLAKRLKRSVPCGTLDITLYRDDLNDPQGEGQPTVRSTEIDFNVDGRLVLLVDDVLHTGRSVRAAMDALVDLGRPRAVRLAVLVDRGGREFPIQANYVGIHPDVPDDQAVRVYLTETDGRDEVVVD
jgi:pyrimidine operon attenuation protein / uracil phosphoribosyltransferase